VAPGKRAIRLVGVFAHPDDDVYSIGGSLILERDRLDVTLVFCTSGDAGPIWVDGIATRETLGEVREIEQAASMAALGVDADVHFLRHPDYHLSEVPFDELVGQVEAVLREVRPDVVVTFGPDGMTTHHDHIRAGEAATAAFHRAREGADDRAFARLLQVALPRSAVDRFYEGLRAHGETSYGEEGTLFNLTGVPDDRIAVTADTRPVLATKLAGVEAHRTQIGELERIPEPLRWIHLETEWFVRAWPPRAPDAPPSPSILADLRSPA
jgi:LmbE family N-acetylglucosaminyl deacetylase